MLPWPQRWRCRIVESRVLVLESIDSRKDSIFLSNPERGPLLQQKSSNFCAEISWRRKRGGYVELSSCTRCSKSILFTSDELKLCYLKTLFVSTWFDSSLQKKEEFTKPLRFVLTFNTSKIYLSRTCGNPTSFIISQFLPFYGNTSTPTSFNKVCANSGRLWRLSFYRMQTKLHCLLKPERLASITEIAFQKVYRVASLNEIGVCGIASFHCPFSIGA